MSFVKLYTAVLSAENAHNLVTSRDDVCWQEEARADSYRYAVQPQTDDGGPKKGKGKGKKKDNLDDLKQELEMVRQSVWCCLRDGLLRHTTVIRHV